MDALKTGSKRVAEATEATDNLVGNKIALKITKAASKATRGDPSRSSVHIDGRLVQPTGIAKKK